MNPIIPSSLHPPSQGTPLATEWVSSCWMGKSSSFPTLFHQAMGLVSHEKDSKHANHQTLRT